MNDIINLQDNAYKIVLYGSYARGDFTKESDIDSLILLNCTKDQVMKYRKQISRLSSRIGLKNDIEISLLLRDRETFEKGKNILPFYQNIKKEGVEIYGEIGVSSVRIFVHITRTEWLDRSELMRVWGNMRFYEG